MTDYVTIPSKGVMYVYLLGLAVSNLCVLITAVPALFEMGGVKFAAMGEVNFCAFIVFHKMRFTNTAQVWTNNADIKTKLKLGKGSKKLSF